MKSEERHRLQANELERWIEKIGHASASFLEAHGLKLVIAAVASVAIIAGAVYWVRSQSLAEAEGWTEIIVAEDAAQYANVAEKYAGSEVGAWARLNEGHVHLAEGISQMFSNTVASGRDELGLAQKAYEDVLAMESLPRAARERAMYGLAQSLEARSASDTGDAVAAYEALLVEFPDSIYKETAEERIETLKRKESQDFYAWFQSAPRQQTSDRDQPFDFNPQRPPQTDSFEIPVLPEIPDLLKLPDVSDDEVSDDENATQPSGTAPPFPGPTLTPDGTPDSAQDDGTSDDTPAADDTNPEASNDKKQPTEDAPAAAAPADAPAESDAPAEPDASAETPATSDDSPAASEKPQGDAPPDSADPS